MIKSKKVISVYSNGHGILEVIEELNKGAKELGKLTLEEQMERAKKRIKTDCLCGGEIGRHG